MNKKQLTERAVELLKNNNVRKHIAAQKTTLHISDDSGNTKDFVIKKSETGLLFTNSDVAAIIDSILAVIEDAIKNGEEITIFGFGTLGLKHRAARQTRHPETGEPIDIKARYVPCFTFGNILRRAAMIYDLSQPNHEAGDKNES